MNDDGEVDGEVEDDNCEDEDEEDEEDEDEEDLGPNFAEISPRGRFRRFHEELGRGAYKIVFKGVDMESGREVAWN